MSGIFDRGIFGTNEQPSGLDLDKRTFFTCDHPGCPQKSPWAFGELAARAHAQRAGWRFVNDVIKGVLCLSEETFCPDHWSDVVEVAEESDRVAKPPIDPGEYGPPPPRKPRRPMSGEFWSYLFFLSVLTSAFVIWMMSLFLSNKTMLLARRQVESFEMKYEIDHNVCNEGWFTMRCHGVMDSGAGSLVRKQPVTYVCDEWNCQFEECQ